MELKKFDQKLLIELDALCRQQRKRLEDFGIAGFTPGDDQQIAERRIDDPWFQTKKQMLIIKNIICPML